MLSEPPGLVMPQFDFGVLHLLGIAVGQVCIYSGSCGWGTQYTQYSVSQITQPS